MIHRDDRDGVRVLTLGRGKANALDLELLRALRDEMGAFDASGARSLVLTGAGSMFCAGVDLKRLVDGGPDYVRAFLPALEAALLAIFTCDRPVVAALNGHAIAGGFVLAAACDRRLMAEGKGRVGLPELHVGVPFPTLVLEILRVAVAPPRLQELLLAGGTQAPGPALVAGLVDEVVAPEALLDAACEAASRMGRLSPAAYASTKRRLREPAIEAWQRRAQDGDAAIVEQWCSSETMSAVRAFVETTL